MAADPLAVSLPSYGYDSLAAVLPAALGSLGIEAHTATGLDAATAAQALGVPRAPAIVVVLCDGLGWHNLNDRLGHAPFLREVLGGGTGRALDTCFPATTAAALATFGTGTAPGRTGLVGYTQRDPDTGELANLIQWTTVVPASAGAGSTGAGAAGAGAAGGSSPAASKSGKARYRHPAKRGRPQRNQAPPLARRPSELQREPTLFEVASAAGAAVASAGPGKFAGSAMTVAALRGGTYLIAETLAQRVDTIVDWVHRAAPALGYLYWGDLDKTGHADGSESAAWGDALSEFDRELRRLVAALPSGTQVILTADHGMLDVVPGQAIDVAVTEALRRDVALVGGESRALHLYLEPGAQAEAVAARWRAKLADLLPEPWPLIRTRAEAVAAGWFGPVAPEVLPWLGDVVVAMLGRSVIVDSRTQSEAARALIGVHGSLTAAETRVPFIRLAGGEQS